MSETHPVKPAARPKRRQPVDRRQTSATRRPRRASQINAAATAPEHHHDTLAGSGMDQEPTG